MTRPMPITTPAPSAFFVPSTVEDADAQLKRLVEAGAAASSIDLLLDYRNGIARSNPPTPDPRPL